MRVAMLLVAAGCFGKPGFTQRDSGSDTCTPSQPSAPGVTIDGTTGPLVTMPGNVAIGFADELLAYPMPDRLIIGGLDVIAQAAGCANEDRVGVAIYPIYSVAAQTPSGGMEHHLERLHVGPAFTSVETRWEYAQAGCTGGAALGEGHTTWSFFPDGKVVRNDTVVPSTTSTIDPTGCQCSSAAGVEAFIVTSYTTFDTTRLRTLTIPSDDDEPASLPGGIIMTQPSACVTTQTGGRVAVAWDRVDNMDPPVPPTRLRMQIPSGPNNITALVYDFVPSTPAVMSILQNRSFAVRTHMLLDQGMGHGTCVAMLEALAAYVNIQPLMIQGLPVAYNEQGVFDDARTYDEPITLSGTLPPGFTVRVRFPGFHAISTSAQKQGVVWQVEGDGEFFVFFPEALTSPLTITPEC